MNRRFVLSNLREAQEELNRTVKEIEDNEEYDYGEYLVAMMHLYHHLNTAWNARDASEESAIECSEANFHKWGQFPMDLPND